MKAGLKRIEATLHDLGTRGTAAESGAASKQSFSFLISAPPPESTDGFDTQPSEEGELKRELEQDFFPHHERVQTFRAQEIGGRTPALPKLKTPNFTSHRNGGNPALAINLLQDIQANVTTWQAELQKIVRQIQDIYLEGPIVNGWLESSPEREPEPKATATLRHAEVDRLMDYVEEICAQQGAKVSDQSAQSARAGYRLCGLDDSGQMWSRPCPAEEVPSVSVAIARYQKLRQLLGRKQYLETRLAQLAETLVVLHGHIQGQ
ncbi:MAG: hypothetical protein ACHBN1_31985 [Heteroscytonema crispum UTEX LB 1556]